jgi:hypothetical protein
VPAEGDFIQMVGGLESCIDAAYTPAELRGIVQGTRF